MRVGPGPIVEADAEDLAVDLGFCGGGRGWGSTAGRGVRGQGCRGWRARGGAGVGVRGEFAPFPREHRAEALFQVGGVVVVVFGEMGFSSAPPEAEDEADEDETGDGAREAADDGVFLGGGGGGCCACWW